MTTLTADKALLAPLLTDRDIEERVDHMIGLANRRQLWWLLLDERGCQLPIVVPIDDLPLYPDAFADEVAARSAELLEMTHASQLLVVWERPGRGCLDAPDAAWARAMADSCARRGIPLRAQVLSHTRGVTLLAPSDFVEPSPACTTAG